MANATLVEEGIDCCNAEELDREGCLISESQPSGGNGEAYYLANFKAVMENCLLSSNPERHVISADEASTVGRFTSLSSTLIECMATC